MRTTRRLIAHWMLSALLVTVTLSGFAQEEPTPSAEIAEPTYWRAEFSSGKYIVAHEFIASVSISDYVVDQSQHVTEVAVGTLGGVAARFIYSEPVAPATRAMSGSSAVLTALSTPAPARPEIPITKTYPATTHAHTVEFRVPDRNTLLRLFDSLEESWITRKSTLFRAAPSDKEE